MMRIAAIAATEAGIEVCCPVHDAFLISAPIDRMMVPTCRAKR
jgi:DNA polymerase I